MDERHINLDGSSWYSFIDWHQELNKHTPTQGVLIYALRKAVELAKIVDHKDAPILYEHLRLVLEATQTHLWDEQTGYFISSKDRQIWMAPTRLWEPQKPASILNDFLETKPDVGITPSSLYHQLVEALIQVGEGHCCN
ncbi:hypothetical protein [Paenibacillus sp. FSL L8-0499]|uniref:hypothetical protein n=1 Tax=Paenibacillus sp. FSL L8-0499 TaxID=2975334 RepID=UPI0030F6B5E3